VNSEEQGPSWERISIWGGDKKKKNEGKRSLGGKKPTTSFKKERDKGKGLERKQFASFDKN